MEKVPLYPVAVDEGVQHTLDLPGGDGPPRLDLAPLSQHRGHEPDHFHKRKKRPRTPDEQRAPFKHLGDEDARKVAQQVSHGIVLDDHEIPVLVVMVFDEERLPVTGTAAPVISDRRWVVAVSYTHLRAHETRHDL